MNGNRGKMASQAGHAYLHAFWDAYHVCDDAVLLTDEQFQTARNKLEQAIIYKDSGLAFKITLVVDTDEELKVLADKYRDKCGVSLVTDAGRTVFNEPTITCVGLGPVDEEQLDEDIRSLKVLI